MTSRLNGSITAMHRVTPILEAAEAEYHALISSVEFAYAFGHGCSIDGSHPRFVAIRERADHLLSIIREHTA